MTSLYNAGASRAFLLASGAGGDAAPTGKDGLALEKLKNYRPSEKEPFMNDRQREYFRAKLLS